MPRCKVVLSICKRNLFSYFSGVLGYLFIVVFVVAGGAMAFNGQFFAANEPNLDQLTQWFPLLLLFFVPAITMSAWADERKTGTDEILFTLPATDVEVLVGKYLAVLGVYTVALVFSTTHVAVLLYLGEPDWGLLFTTYFGYWVAGAAMLSAGMLASVLTNSMTVAFILGVVVCGIPVFIGFVGQLTGARDFFESLSLSEQFRDFGMGIIPLQSLVYFVSFTALMLYMNLILITRRHWASSNRTGMGLQFSVRAICLAIALLCLSVWSGAAAVRVDATSERLFSLSPTTRKILRELDSERPIQIQAFVSSEVPGDYVDTHKRFVGLLRQFDELGGSKLAVRQVEVEPFSERAEEAEHFGIEAREIPSERDGRVTIKEFYLGFVVISSYDKVVVPFVGRDLPIEYELTRSVQTVAKKERHTVGIMTTDAGLLAGEQEWQIVTELKKQYDVEEVSPDDEIDTSKFDVLLAAMPSSLTDPQMDNFVAYVKSGNPVLIFDDPFPVISRQGGITLAPRQQKPTPGGHMAMMMGGRQPQPEPKADGGQASRLLDVLGLEWKYDEITFNVNNPHSEFGTVAPEIVFVTRDDNPDAFNKENPVTKGLQEVVVLYSGTVRDANKRGHKYQPLLVSGAKSGLLEWSEFAQEIPTFFGTRMVQPSPDPFRVLDTKAHALAAYVTSEEEDAKVNAVFVADIDIISDLFFRMREERRSRAEFDNVTFVLNAVDMLAGDEGYIELRSRRAKHRALTRIDAQRRKYLAEENDARKRADEEAKKELKDRTEKLGKRAKEISENESLDRIAKAQQLQQAEQAEQQRLDLAKAQIEQRKRREIRKIVASRERKERSHESMTRAWAVWLPPIPALCVGLFVFAWRLQDERKTVSEKRRRHTGFSA